MEDRVFARLSHLEFTEERFAPPFDEDTVSYPQDADEETKAKILADAVEKHIEENGWTRMAITRAHAQGIGEMAGEHLTGEIIIRPGGMLVFAPQDSRVITTPDDAIAAAREREADEYQRLGVVNHTARTGGERGIMPEAARVPGTRPRRGGRQAQG